MGTQDIAADSPMKPYLEAKRDADRALADSGLRWTIVRPGRLTNDPGTGMVGSPRAWPTARSPRDDVAAVLYACLSADNTVQGAFDLVSGPVSIQQAVDSFTAR